MDLKILGRMVLDLIKFLGNYLYENNIIKKVKNYNPSKGEKSHWKGERVNKGRPLGRILRGK